MLPCPGISYIPGQGSTINILQKKKINGKRSTEGKLIGVYNVMAKILCPIYFIEEQGYKIAHNRLMKDNKSAMLLVKWKLLQIQLYQTHQN